MAEEDDKLIGNKDDKADSPDGGDDDSHCFPYYDFIASVFRRFNGSFVAILMIENFNFGLWILVTLET